MTTNKILLILMLALMLAPFLQGCSAMPFMPVQAIPVVFPEEAEKAKEIAILQICKYCNSWSQEQRMWLRQEFEGNVTVNCSNLCGTLE
ncbi:hypothetical protein LCGC14_1246160 [marine sediment metagenome]|uniref:Uncharacterized protein n=1 Tax=marine sediment metagenome TaxID=412755 RepID=A0A0F9LRC8_9ZZZZ